MSKPLDTFYGQHSLAFISANSGAQEVLGMAREWRQIWIIYRPFLLARCGVRNDTWIYMMPFILAAKRAVLPEYLKLRFDEKTRIFNALTFAQ